MSDILVAALARRCDALAPLGKARFMKDFDSVLISNPRACLFVLSLSVKCGTSVEIANSAVVVLPRFSNFVVAGSVANIAVVMARSAMAEIVIWFIVFLDCYFGFG